MSATLAAGSHQPPGVPPKTLMRLAQPDSAERIAVEAILGARSLSHFFRMAWPYLDPSHLLWNWHLQLLCDEMEAVARRQTQEAVFAIPPRSSKSNLISVAFPAWVWTWFPGAKFITGANEMNLAIRDAVRHRRLVKSSWYQARWGPQGYYTKWKTEQLALEGKPAWPGVDITSDQDNKSYFTTTAGGERFCCTPNSNVTGYGGDFVLCDDPHPVNKSESEAERSTVLNWWFEAIPSRLNEQDRGVKMVVQQRTHSGDLAGECIRRGYHRVVLPMRFEPDHPDRHPKDPRVTKGELLHAARTPEAALKKLEDSLGPYATAGQLQQRPVARGGGLFKRHWFRFVEAVPAEAARNRVRRWDLAATAPEPGKDPDYTAGVLMSRTPDNRYFIEHVIRFREEEHVVRETIKALAISDGIATRIRIPQDPGQAGKAQVKQYAGLLAGNDVGAMLETGDKYTRALQFVPQCAVGNVYLVRGSWNEEFLDELCQFPNADHDDQVDAAVGAFLDMFEGSAAAWEEYYASLQAQAEEQAFDDRAGNPRNIQFQQFG